MGEELKLRVCTWNVGNAPPPDDLQPWLGAAGSLYDIIVVGAQEANYSQGDRATLNEPEISTGKSKSHSTNERSESREQDMRTKRGRLKRAKSMISRTHGGHKSSTPSAALQKSQSKRHGRMRRKKHTDEDRWWEDLVQPSDSDDVGVSDIENTSEDMSCRQKLSDTASLDFPSNNEQFSRLESNSPKCNRHLEPPTPVATRNIFRENWSAGPVQRIPSQNVRRKCNEMKLENEESNAAIRMHSHHPGAHNRKDVILLNRVRSISDTFVLPRGLSRKNSYRKEQKANDTSEEQDPHAKVEKGLFESLEMEQRPTQSKSQTKRIKRFSKCVENSMPREYKLVAKQHMMEIKLFVFVHSRHLDKVIKTKSVSEATGIGNIVGNKGGVAVKLTLEDTTFCFVSSHLAAHEGAKFLQERNEDVMEIMRNVEQKKVHGPPTIQQFHHVFWMGDLNYRLDLQRTIPESLGWSQEQKWSHVVGLISTGRFCELAQSDELVHEKLCKIIFGGFEEGQISFPPTFKVVRGARCPVYQTSRIPSYCDRILWHSLPLHKNHVKIQEYNYAPSIDTSDHKPVYAVFNMFIPQRVLRLGMPAPLCSLKCTLDFISLRVHGLYEKKRCDSRNGSECKKDFLAASKRDLLDRLCSESALHRNHSLDIGEYKREMRPKSALTTEKGRTHTRRIVRAHFYGSGIFLWDDIYKTEVPLKAGRVRKCGYHELPTVALRPIRCLSDLQYKYITIVFTRMGSKHGTSCVLPLAAFSQGEASRRVKTTLELTKYGNAIARVDIEAELIVSKETWRDVSRKHIKASKA